MISKWKTDKKRMENLWNDNYTTGNLLDSLYDQKCYQLIGIDLLRQTNTTIPQQIDFTGKKGEDDGATMFFVSEKQQKIF